MRNLKRIQYLGRLLQLPRAELVSSVASSPRSGSTGVSLSLSILPRPACLWPSCVFWTLASAVSPWEWFPACSLGQISGNCITLQINSLSPANLPKRRSCSPHCLKKPSAECPLYFLYISYQSSWLPFMLCCGFFSYVHSMTIGCLLCLLTYGWLYLIFFYNKQKAFGLKVFARAERHHN